MPSATGTAAPERPVPLPRATTGTPRSSATRRTAATSRRAGRTTASGPTGTAVSASSWV